MKLPAHYFASRRRSVVMADNGLVATSQLLAAQDGKWGTASA
jgi:hypothetical protein